MEKLQRYAIETPPYGKGRMEPTPDGEWVRHKDISGLTVADPPKPDGWIPGIPSEPEPDRLYAVMGQPDSGYGVGIVIRGADCNWRSSGIIAHYPLPLTMTQAKAMKLKRRGVFDIE